jgi:hypothetical protein
MLMILCSVACDRTPGRPARVPETAVWNGGADGGVWVDCREDIKRDVNICAVYDEWKGELIIDGDFQLVGKNRAARRDEMAFAGFADRKIYLRGGLVLARTSEEKSH